MARHRNIRGRNFDDDYEGYDDVYGHSVEDDYGVSPSTAEQFMYHRGGHELSSYLEDIGEDDRDDETDKPLVDSRNYQRPKLSEEDEVRLQSCLDEIRNVVGDTTPEHILIDAVVASKFNYEKALDTILNKQENNHKKDTAPSVVKTGPTSASLKPNSRESNGQHSNQRSVTDNKLSQYNDENDKMSCLGLKGLIEGREIGSLKTDSKEKMSMQFMPKGMQLMTTGPNKPLVGSSMQKGGITLAELSKMQGKVDGKPSQSGAVESGPVPKESQRIGKSIPMPGKVGPSSGLSLAELAAGAGTGNKNKSSNTATNIPQLSGSRNQPSGNVSLADLASGHLSSSPKSQQGNLGKPPGMKTKQGGSVSLADLATSRSSPLTDSLLVTSLQKNATQPGKQTSVSSGKSLADLASGHLSSSPKTTPLWASQNRDQTSGITAKQTGGVSLADLASGHLSSSPKSSPYGITPREDKTHVKSKQTVSLSDLATSRSNLACQASKNSELINQKTRPISITKKAKVGNKNASSPVESHQTKTKSSKAELAQQRVPPGFEPMFDFDTSAPSQGLSTTPPSSPPLPKGQSLSSSHIIPPFLQNQPEPSQTFSLWDNQEYNFHESHTGRHSLKKSKETCPVMSPPSSFGTALCQHCLDPPARVDAIAQGRVGFHGVQRRVLHRQFSFERQKSRQELVEEKKLLPIKPFDFSRPSPDDCVRQRQRGVFQPLSQSGPQRTDNFPDTDSRLRPTPDLDEASSQVTRLSFAGKDPKQGFKVRVEDTGPGSGDEGRGAGAEARKGALSPTRLSEESSSRRSSRESLTYVSSEPDLQAFASASSTPSRKEGRKASTIDISKELEKRQAGKELLNLVVIGHVDAGKSTLMGHLLYLLGQVNQRLMHKYRTESQKQGKASFAYAWVLDETGEERERGITMDVGLTRFETSHRLVTLLDAPGHKDFIPNMITGAAQADAAILVVDATRGEFETGFESGGQTREHALLVRSLGVRQLVVGVNKLDTVGWAEDRFKDIVKKLGAFLKQAGFKESDIVYIPCSGLTGENLTEKAKEPSLTSWYRGPCLLDHIDKLKPPKRSVDLSMRLCVSDVFKGMGSGVSASGKIETGSVQIGEKIIVMPSGENGLIKGISVHDEDARWACAGDHTTVVVTGVDQMKLTVGSVICSFHDPIRAATRFQARVVIFNIEVPLTKGFPVLVHYQSVSEPAIIKRLVSVLHKSTGEVVQKKPKCLTKQMNAILEIETTRPVCLELYKDYKELGRFMLRYGGATIAAGVVTQIKN